MSSPIRIAIVGGSIAGMTLANGLTNLSDLHFDVFDGKSSFKERGAAVGIAPNAQKALRTMSIDPDKLLKDAGAMQMGSTYALVGTGEHKGKTLLRLPGGVYAVDRMQLLEQLLKPVPSDRLHANKKLVSISSDNDNTYTLHFTASTTAGPYDIVIGCDGHPKFGGYWDARGRMTPSEAAEKFGTDLFNPEEANEVALVGKDSFLLFAPSDNGAVYHVIVSCKASAKFDTTSWKTELSRKFLEEAYVGWEPKFRDAVIDALMAEDSGPGVVFSEWESPPAPTYIRLPGLVMMGDAAHATVPWMGQGACMSIEDAAVLSHLLSNLTSKVEIPAALQAFDETRRGRPEYVVRQSQATAELLTGQVSMDPEEVKHLRAEEWFEKVWGIDMEGHVRGAVEVMRAGRTE